MSKRIVMKFGTRVLSKVEGNTARFDSNRLTEIAEKVYGLMKCDSQVAIVTSAAVQLGIEKLGVKRPKKGDFKTNIEYADELAILAGLGTDELASRYQKAFQKHDLKIAYTLFTSNNFGSDERKGICRRLNKTLDKGIIPITNTNDFVTLEELMPIYNGDGFSDNDPFAYYLSYGINADEVYFVTTSAVYDKDPNKYNDARKIDVLTKDVFNQIDCIGTSGIGRGGMEQKIKSGFKCAKKGMLTYIIGFDELDKVGKSYELGTRIE